MAEYYNTRVPGEALYDLVEPIQIRKITPIEQKRFLSLLNNEATNEELIKFINQLIIGVDPTKLYWPDYYYILYQLRLTSYKMIPLNMHFKCPECGEHNKIEIDITKLKVDDIPETYTRDTKINLENFGEVPIRYKQVGDDIACDMFMKQRRLDEKDDNLKILVYDLLLLSNWKPLNELWALAENGDITVQDIALIEKFIDDNTWGVREEYTYVCRHCNKEVSNPFAVRLDDFFPSNFS